MNALFTFTVLDNTYQASKRSGSAEPYSVHRVNPDNGSLFWGKYFRDPQAMADHIARLQRYADLVTNY